MQNSAKIYNLSQFDVDFAKRRKLKVKHLDDLKEIMNVSTVQHLDINPDDPDKDEYFYSIKKRIYQAAKEGFSINLQVHITRVENPEIRCVLVNQVSSLKMFGGKEN